MNYLEIASHIRARILAHIRNAWKLVWAGKHRLAAAARAYAARMQEQLGLLRAAATGVA